MAALLGAGGLIPFLAGSGYLCLGPVLYAQVVSNALIGYGAVILAFLGAVHWGLYLTVAREDSLRLVLGITPSLIGWGALLLALLGAPVLGLVLLILGFLGIFLVDWQTVKQGLVPAWYGRLRLRLSLVVLPSLVLAGLSF